MPSDSGAAWSPPASNGERRLSNSSDGSAGSGYSKTLSSDSADFLATRPHTAAVLPGKPAGNPLQFVRVGPAELGSRAREQLRKAELAKRTEPAKVEQQEDWQSNLDNWKSSRRKRVEPIIERCVEIKRLGNEPCLPRGKGKTFNEMLEERAGRRRRNPLALYTDDDGHDLSDLGIGTCSTKSSLSEDCDTHSLASDGMDLDKNHSDIDNMSNCDLANRKLGSSANEYDTCTTNTISSPEPEEYTYEGAIESYKSRIISQTNSSIVKTVVDKELSPEKSINGDLNRIRTNVSNKIEEKLSSFQQERANDAKNNNQKSVPKVDIHKRREQFERENSREIQINKPKLQEISNKVSIKDRLSNLEKFTEETVIQRSTHDLTKLPADVKPLKERLSSLEKVKSGYVEPEKIKRLSNGDLNANKSLKERLSSLKSQTSEEEVKSFMKNEVKEVSMSLKERLSCLDAAKNKEIPKISVDEQLHHNESKIEDSTDINERSLKLSLSGIESQMQSFCRSLDSLDINGQSSPNSFDRVQSYEDFDAEMQNNTVPSDIETEDSGIHTARDSCAPADDIADLTQVASPIGGPMVEASEYESSNEETPMKAEEPIMLTPEPNLIEETIIEEIDDCKTEDTDSASHYVQAVSQPEDFSATSEITEIQMDKDDEDTLKSLDNQDTSVSVCEPASTSSDGDTVVFEGKMTIHVNLNEICSTSGVGDNANTIDSPINRTSMPMVTVSNITTTTNISPKNSIKTLRANETLPNHLACTSAGTPSNTNVTTNIVLNAASENAAVGNSQDSNPFWQKRVRRCVEPNRRKTILLINNRVLDALELAFKELDSSEDLTSTMEGQSPAKALKDEPKPGPIEVTPLYENIDIFYQNGGAEVAFPLDLPQNILEPPKEKPPPPPTEDNDELLGNGNFKHTSSARRIKKEIRNKRTSFLGIEGQLDDDYLDAETLTPRPDITSFLQQESKIEKLLYKKTLSHEMDASLRESRDSGVDVDRGPGSEPWRGSTTHSRQSSEPTTHVTVTSDEEESGRQQFSSHLTTKLETLQAQDQPEGAVQQVQHAKQQHQPDQAKIESLDRQIVQQQARTNEDCSAGLYDDAHTKEVLRFERELLQLEQEELRRQRDNLIRDQTRIVQKSHQDVSTIPASPEKPPLIRPPKIVEKYSIQGYRHSMPNLLANENYSLTQKPTPVERAYTVDESLKRKPFVSEEHIQRHFGVEESRKVLYDESKFGQTAQLISRPPQPILPPRPRARDSVEREVTMRSSRVPSAVEYANVDRMTSRQNPVAPSPAPAPAPPPAPAHLTSNGQYQSMSRHTLQALSAAPTPKLITSAADWMQNRTRKSTSYNYNQHWLIQEAEQRRIEEQRVKMRAPQRHSYHQDMTAMQRMQHLSASQQHLPARPPPPAALPAPPAPAPPALVPPPPRDDKLLSVSGKRKCSHCGEELGRGAAMIIESLSLCYHVWCFTCAVCGARLGDGRAGADVRVRGSRLHCHHCYSGDDGRKYSAV